jgi:tetratricopeptide (TPR) repeat protein
MLRKSKHNPSPPVVESRPHTELRKVDFNRLLDGALLFSSKEDISSSSQSSPSLPVEATVSVSLPEAQTQTSQPVYLFYDQAIKLVRNGQYSQASELLQQVVFIDLNSRTPNVAIKCCDFWTRRFHRLRLLKGLEIAHFLFESWQSFNSNVLRETDGEIERLVFTIKMQVFGHVVKELTNELHVKPGDSDVLVFLARAHKMRGDFDEAIDLYAEVLNLENNRPEALAELADCYAVIDEEVHAKALFREAFFHGAERIDSLYLESAMYIQLEQKTFNEVYTQSHIQEWMAVYGVVYGVFGFARELNSAEYARLNQSIHALRIQLEENLSGEKRNSLVPRLLYRLFWLIDYYLSLGVEVETTRENIKKVLLEIRFLDERVYKKYKL